MADKAKQRTFRTEVVATRFTPAEAEALDAMRGSLTRAEWLRWLQLQAAKTRKT